MIFTSLDIYISGNKVWINCSQVAIPESAWKYCESIRAPYISITVPGRFLLTKFHVCLQVITWRKKLAVSNNFVENFYSTSPLPPSSWFIFSKITGSGWYGNKKRSLKDACFQSNFLLSEFLLWYKTRYWKAFISSKVADSERNRSIGSRYIHVLHNYSFQFIFF